MKYEYIIRTVKEDYTSYNNFTWPKSGQVKADDFKPTLECGNGLHGLRIGQQQPGKWYGDGIVLLLKVPSSTIIDLEDNSKCKFPECKIVMSGNMNEITNYLYKKNINIEGLYRRTQLSNKSEKWTGGDRSTLTAGDYSRLTAGHFSTLTAGHSSTLTAGACSTLTAGHSSTLTAGYYSTLTAGSDSTLTAGSDSTLTAGSDSTLTAGVYSTLTAGEGSRLTCEYYNDNKIRLAIAYVGENDIKPNQAYRVNNKGEFYEV